MPEFNEKLELISRLREKCRRCDESLYRARLELYRTNQQLRRADQQPTIVNSDRDREAATLRAKIERLNTRLATLRETARQLAQWFARLAEERRLIEHLQQNLTVTQNRIAALRERLAELQQEEPPPADKIEAIEIELARLERVLADVSLSLRKARESLRELEEREAGQRHRQEEVQQEIERLREELGALQGELTELLQPAFPDRDALGSRRAEIENRGRDLEEQCGNCEGELHDAIVGLYHDPHPREGLRNLDDGTPFLLFPVRIETIFVPIQGDVAAGTELWVRIYPDDIVVHTHEKVLTDREVLGGELYWTELLTAEHLRDERDNRRRAAWRHIVELFGGQRAAWIASHTKPSDWDTLVAGAAARTLPELLVAADAEFFDKLLATSLPPAVRTALENALTENDGDAFSQLAEKREWFGLVNAAVKTVITGFPVHDLTKTDLWTRAPRTQLLPDRFVLLLSNNDGPQREIVGNVIPDTLFLGPDPLASETAFPTRPEDDALVYGNSFDWMSNFDKAVEQGMGFRVRLNEAEARRGFARVLVLGVFLSATAPDSAALLEELIDNHHYSPKGFSIVPQGTPTNNTERDGTGYSNNDPYDDRAFFTAIDPPAFDPNDTDPAKSQTDGRFLADALGISYEPLQTIQYAKQTDLLEASSMNAALFPGTLGYWLRNWMSPVVTPETARQARSFFTRFVTGRGPLPAVRIGDQPYGLLLTSDFSRWKYPVRSRSVRLFEDEVAFLRKLHSLLLALQQIWANKVSALPYIGKPFTESGDVLMKILGLHPNSVEFYQRIGYSHEYLGNLFNFKGKGRFTGELRTHMMLMPDRAHSYLMSLGIVKDFKTVSDMLSLQVLWQHYTSNLDSPNLVENKPPSEKNGLTVNYIDFLANADNTQKIITQDFPTTPPSALLYLMLRNALLLQLHSGAYEWLKERTIFHPVLEQATRATSLADVRPSSPTVSKLEIMGARVEVAEPTNPVPSTTVADWIWQGPSPTEVEAAFLREQKAALTNLVKTPTARLERCFIEHLDCCNYRLDAWQTGMFAQRLQSQRGSGQGRQKGIYLGAFGWVENLSPGVKKFLSPESLPTSLRPADTQPILEEDDVMASLSARTRVVGSRQGGFVHAPSLNHAAAAALLRNAYLSHARPEQPDMFSVNLSSERVRRGQFILEGMRNGQPIEALLGYQFERGLHDRTSASNALDEDPVLELNQFIVPYREAFPFESVELAQTGTGAPSETIPPYSVVNGLKLSQATLSAANAFGLANVLPAALRPKPSHGLAILAEQNALLDTLDAVKDLLLAENAFQLARGNFDRVAAVSLAQKEAHIPPELEVINTPRGTEFTFTNRVTLHFEDVDPETNPWFPAPMTPRATAEPGMNQWLASLLGQPGQIFCKVFWIEKEGDLPRNPHRVALAELGIQPIDFVWLTNLSTEETQGATELETRSGATELETRIAYVYRSTHGVGDDKIVKIEFNPDVAPGETSFAQLFPLARQLRALLSESRALHAGDFLPAAGGKESEIPVDKDNPKGYDAAELKSRVQTALTDLSDLANLIDGPGAASVEIVFLNDPATPADDEIFVGKLGDALTKLEETKLTFTDITRLRVTFSLLHAEGLHANLQAVASFGISDAFPPESDLTVEAAKISLLARAHRLARRLRRADPQDGVLDRATALVGDATTDKSIEQLVILLLEAGKILFGETFSLLPKFTCHNEVDLATAAGDRTQLLSFATTPEITEEEVVDEWLQGLARVRKPLEKWEVVRALADALSDVTLKVEPVQVPYRANDSWLAVEFPKLDPNNTDPEEPEKPFGISRDTLSIAAHGNAAFQAGVKQSGVLLDDWTEEIPTEKEITGITFRFNQPNAAPPQTMLLAVTPEETGSWEWDDLVGTLNDTLERAKRRAVEPSHLEPQGRAWNAFAPALVSEFSTRFRNDISLDLLGMMDIVELNEFYTRRV
ncbi:MAG: hypothetical protein ACR2LM_02045 [Pyrinomonadaceae bacterium]